MIAFSIEDGVVGVVELAREHLFFFGSGRHNNPLLLRGL
jgi:hypothetical protein